MCIKKSNGKSALINSNVTRRLKYSLSSLTEVSSKFAQVLTARLLY